MFKEDLTVIDRLRTDAVTSLEAHASGVRKLAGYAAQVVWVGGKFPVDVSGVCGVMGCGLWGVGRGEEDVGWVVSGGQWRMGVCFLHVLLADFGLMVDRLVWSSRGIRVWGLIRNGLVGLSLHWKRCSLANPMQFHRTT